MLDIKFLRENPEVVKQNIRNKFQDQKQRLVNHILQSCYLIIWQYLIIKTKQPGNTL